MIYLSAGHHFNEVGADPGAVANGYKEHELTRELRDLTVAAIREKGGSVIVDKDEETLAAYIKRIKPGSGSVVCEIHFNAVSNENANGVECLYGWSTEPDEEEVEMCKEICAVIADIAGLRNRGAKSDAESARGKLAILRTPAGLSCLPEICFITNKDDMAKYQAAKFCIAQNLADILIKYDAKRT